MLVARVDQTFWLRTSNIVARFAALIVARSVPLVVVFATVEVR